MSDSATLESRRPDSSSVNQRVQYAFLGYVCVAAALTVSPALQPGEYGGMLARNWLGFCLLWPGLAFALLAACHRQTEMSASRGSLAIRLVLLLWFELFYVLRDPPETMIASPVVLAGLWIAYFSIGALSWTYNRPSWPWPRLRCAAILGLFAVLAATLVASADEPIIDVWHLQQQACARLLHGENPYSGLYTHRFNAEQQRAFLAPDILQDGKIRSFPYPPLSLLLAVPGYLVGDVRWSYLAALIGTAALMLATMRRLGLPWGHPAELGVWLYLFHPHTLFVLEQSWTEPFVALALTGLVWAAASKHRGIEGPMLAAVLSMKQFAVLALAPLWASGQFSVRTLATGILLSLALALPFWLWDSSAFWLGTVHFHLSSPFRNESMSVLAVVANSMGIYLPSTLSLLAAGTVACLLLWRQVRGLAGIGLGTAAILLAFLLFSKAAHVNYFWLAAFALALGLVLLAAEEPVAEFVGKTNDGEGSQI